MMIDKLRNRADYEELIKGVDETFLREVTGKSPEYQLGSGEAEEKMKLYW